jgi:translation initiation factor IF-2
MDKIRIYDLSRELGVSAKEVLNLLRELGVEAKSHASSVDQATATAIKELFQEQKAAAPKPPQEPPLVISGDVTVSQVAELLKFSPLDLTAKLTTLGIEKGANQFLSRQELENLTGSFGRQLVIEEKAPAKPEVARHKRVLKESTVPPVVVVMGHVDHGKTALLDAIRNTNVIEQEHGGITQHIGASEIQRNGRRIVFLDTPGHEAFTQIRARGAQVTDIAVLVVAADEGVMPQTIEAVDHAKAAEVPIVVAINKIDLPGANPERIKQQLASVGLIPEEWGGETVFVETSAKLKTGMDELLEMLLLVADIKGLEARMDGPATGVVIESKLDASRGPLATVIIKEGTLRRGDCVLSGEGYGRVRQMTNWLGKPIAQASPGTPVEVSGLSELPPAGQTITSAKDPREAKAIVRERQEERKRQSDGLHRRPTFDELLLQIQQGQAKELRLVVKADAQGSIDAIVQAVSSLQEGEVVPRVLHQGIGLITESDILLASSAQAVVIGFNVHAEAGARKIAQVERVEIRLYNIIYQLLEDVQNLLRGLIEPEYREVTLGAAEVRQLFRISRLGVIAGCYVTNGTIVRGQRARILRAGNLIHDGVLASLKHLKEDVGEMAAGFECGIMLVGFNDFQEGDLIEVYQEQQVSPSLT